MYPHLEPSPFMVDPSPVFDLWHKNLMSVLSAPLSIDVGAAAPPEGARQGGALILPGPHWACGEVEGGPREDEGAAGERRTLAWLLHPDPSLRHQTFSRTWPTYVTGCSWLPPH